jgi:threonine synthase
MSAGSARYICPGCDTEHPIESPLWRCPACGSHLNLTDGPGLTPDGIDRDVPSLWRYAAALRVPGEAAISLGEGATPLVARDWGGQLVHFKLDFMAPTGSFKDRGTTVLMSYLKWRGVTAILEDSSGNAGASMAAYTAAAGMDCRILVPASAPAGKLVQMRAAGAEVVPVPGTRQEVSDAAFAEAETRFYASHNWQPFFLEGTKTAAYEIWEQLGFRAPDNVVVPAGGGSNVIGCHIGFRELLARGQIDRLPRIFAVQAAACAPVCAAFDAGTDAPVEVPVSPSAADGIAIARPVHLREMLDAVRATGGACVAVSEKEIVAALKGLVRAGLFVEPTSATAAAAVTRLAADGRIGKDETTALILTGSGLKAIAKVGQLLGLES